MSPPRFYKYHASVHREGAPKCVWNTFTIEKPGDGNIKGKAAAQGLEVRLQSLLKENQHGKDAPHPGAAARRRPEAFVPSSTELAPRGAPGPRSARTLGLGFQVRLRQTLHFGATSSTPRPVPKASRGLTIPVFAASPAFGERLPKARADFNLLPQGGARCRD